MTENLLGLVMMVKNEAASIRAVLEAVLPHVNRATILDTGSTDGTQDIIKETCAAASKPLALFDGLFTNYGETRNRVMELDRSLPDPSRFQFMLSGDEYLSGGEQLREELDKHLSDDVDLFVIRVVLDGKTMFSPRIFRTGSPWHYIKRVHEFPTHPNPEAKIGAIEGATIEHVVSDWESRLNAIWEVHIPMLQEDLEKDPNDTHAMMFLAQSYEELFPGFSDEERKQYAREAVRLRAQRLCLPGEPAEKHFCMMHLIDSARVTGDYTPQALYEMIEQQCEADPYRPDAAILRAELAMTVKPVIQVYALACHAVKVAETARQLVNASTIDMNCVWQAHRIAAICAKQYAAAHPNTEHEGKTFEDRMQEHIQAGLDAGGPWLVFKAIVTPPVSEVPPEETPPAPPEASA